MRIKDLPPNQSLKGTRFRYPGGGKYYWVSQWNKGVWGRKNLNDTEVHPLFVDDLRQALEWKVVK